MLARRREPEGSARASGNRGSGNKAAAAAAGAVGPSDGTAKQELGPSTSTATSSAHSARGQKRKAQGDDPHDEKGSEFLRRKHGFIKSTIRVDYQPDICKDYKETGFCGFGDSCKFLHDRSDYKHGWQLEQEYAKGLHKDEPDDKYLIKDNDDEEEDDDGGSKLECPVCKEPFKCPVETKCKHRFCEKCFDANCIDTCFVCHKATGGVQSLVRDKSAPKSGNQTKGRWK